jgi:hypothetical protein
MKTNLATYDIKLDNICGTKTENIWEELRQEMMFNDQHITFKFSTKQFIGLHDIRTETILCYVLSD